MDVDSGGPLKGIKVVELGVWIAGPSLLLSCVTGVLTSSKLGPKPVIRTVRSSTSSAVT